MAQFDHERLDAYQVAIDFVALANDVVENLPRGRSHLSDQLQRASLSVPLNIAEGAIEFSAKDKNRLYRGASRRRTGNGNGNGNEPEVRRVQALTLNDQPMKPA